MVTEYYYEYESVDNPSLKGHRHLTTAFVHNGEPRDAVESDFMRDTTTNMKEDERQGWSVVQKVRVNVWRAKDGQRTGDPIFIFTFSPDDHGYNDLK